MAEGIMGLMDSMPDEGPPADARDTSSPNFGQGMSTMEMYEILMPLARMVAEQTGEPVQAILQEMATDPTAISRAKSMLGMDPTTPFPNNIREPMTLKPGEVLLDEQGKVLGQGQSQRQVTLGPGQTVMDSAGNVIAPLTQQEKTVVLKPGELVIDSSGRVISDAGIAPPSQQLADPNQRYTLDEIRKIMELGRGMGIGEQMMLKPGEMVFPSENAISLPQRRPTMSERLLSQMSLKD